MLADRRLVLLLPLLELLKSDMGDMQELRPDREEMPLSECEWLCRGGLGCEGLTTVAELVGGAAVVICGELADVGLFMAEDGGEVHSAAWPGGGAGPASRLFFHQFEIDLRDRSLLR